MPPAQRFWMACGNREKWEWQPIHSSYCHGVWGVYAPTDMCWCEKHQQVFVEGYQCLECGETDPVDPLFRSITDDWQPSQSTSFPAA